MEGLPTMSMKHIAAIIEDDLKTIQKARVTLLLAKTMKRSAGHFYEMLDNLCNWWFGFL